MASAFGVKFEPISAPIVIRSVLASPNVRSPFIIASPCTFKYPNEPDEA